MNAALQTNFGTGWTSTFIGMKSIGTSDATAATKNKRDISAIVLQREMRILP